MPPRAGYLYVRRHGTPVTEFLFGPCSWARGWRRQRASAPRGHRWLSRLLAWRSGLCLVLLARLLPAPARSRTRQRSFALTSFGVRGTPSGSPALPTPPALHRSIWRRSLPNTKVWLQLTRCACRGGTPQPPPGLLGVKGRRIFPSRGRSNFPTRLRRVVVV
jgi:hypothetical protein